MINIENQKFLGKNFCLVVGKKYSKNQGLWIREMDGLGDTGGGIK